MPDANSTTPIDLTRRPFGAWPTPITADLVVQASVSLGGPVVADGWLWWSELRPAEQGRVQVVGKPKAGAPSEATGILPSGWSARTMVHEYGGRSFWLTSSTVVFANQRDQRLYRVERANRPDRSPPVPVSPEPDAPQALRYADLDVHPDGDRFVCVQEAHGEGGVANTIIARSLTAGGGDEADVLVSGPDFVSNPRIAPDGSALCWLEWNHPSMPWDRSELWVAHLDDNTSGPSGPPGLRLVDRRRIAGGPGVSIAQPEWSPEGRLHWVSDEGTGWWNLTNESGPVVTGLFEAAQPQWVFGQSWYGWNDRGALVDVRRYRGCDHLHIDGRPALPRFTAFDGVRGDGDGAVMIASGFTTEPAVVEVDHRGDSVVHRPARDLGIDTEWFSLAEHMTFPTTDVGAGPAVAHALFYRPTNPTVIGPGDERPPLLVLSHGGPTSAARPTLNLAIQYWTSRGFAVADVNYRGSTGYGRPYRDALQGAWGVADVDDCIACARFLAERGDVDGARLAIKGGSAGGYTTLCALAFHDVFRAGSSLYGVADLETLATDTHKFESRYLDGLIGPYPERRDRYVERSPIHHLDRLDCPLIIFQGLDDAIVPPSQAEQIVAVLREKGLPFAYLAFAGEQHGFRQAANIRRVLEAEHYFFAQVFGFDPPEGVEPVEIENLRNDDRHGECADG